MSLEYIHELWVTVNSNIVFSSVVVCNGSSPRPVLSTDLVIAESAADAHMRLSKAQLLAKSSAYFRARTALAIRVALVLPVVRVVLAVLVALAELVPLVEEH